jgi:hypothetical protein
MEHQVTFNGSTQLVAADLELASPAELAALAEAASVQLRRGRHGHGTLALRVTPTALEGRGDAPTVVLPLGKLVLATAHTEGTLKRAHLCTVLAYDERSRRGGPRPAMHVCV